MPLDTTDVPQALTELDTRLTALEMAPHPATAAGDDPRVVAFEAIMTKYFGKEYAEALSKSNNPAPNLTPPATGPAGGTVTPGA